jgi:hypothetical protein
MVDIRKLYNHLLPDTARPRQSPRIAIRWVLGAPRLTTSGCSRLRAQASELAHVLATDPRRLAEKDIKKMGYRISTIANLPIIPNMKLYVFVLGERCWEGGFSSIIEKNFAKLAKNLGRDAMLVTAHEGIDLGHELIDAV